MNIFKSVWMKMRCKSNLIDHSNATESSFINNGDDIEDEFSNGAVYSFPINKEEFGACRIISHFPKDCEVAENHYLNDKKEECFLVVTTPWISNHEPNLNENALREVLILNHHSWQNVKCYWIVNGYPPNKFNYLGNVPFKDDFQNYSNKKWGSWSSVACSEQLLKQREWDTGNPEEILAKEQEIKLAMFEKEKKKEENRIARLQNISLNEYKNFKPFEKWNGSTISAEAIAEFNNVFKVTIERIIDLGEKPKKRLIMVELKLMIASLKKLETKYDYIETSERDDICVLLGDILHLLKLKDDPSLLFEKWW